MSELKGKMADTFRQSLEAEMAQVNTLSERIVREGENKLCSKFNNMFGNVKLEGSKHSLNMVVNEENSSLLLDGKVTITASVISGKSTKKISVDLNVNHNQVSLPEDSDLKALVNTAPEENVLEATEDPINEIVADLGQFELKDTGSDILKVYHPAIDTGKKELGIVTKNEYTNEANKESLLKSILENQVKHSYLENHYTLKFEGSFTHPNIVLEDQPTYDLTPADEAQGEDAGELRQQLALTHGEAIVHGEFSPEVMEMVKKLSEMTGMSEQEILETAKNDAEFVNSEKDMSTDMHAAKMPDMVRQASDFEQQRMNNREDKIVNLAINDHVKHLRQLGYEDVKVLSVDKSALKFDGESFTGDLKIETSLQNMSGLKIASIPFTIQGDNFKFPTTESVKEAILKGTDVKAKVEADLAEEVKSAQVSADEMETWKESEVTAVLKGDIKKEAGEFGGIQTLGPVDKMEVERHLLDLPEDTEIGTTLFADGSYWKLISKSKNALSGGLNDGNIWTIEKVKAEDVKEEPEHTVQN